MVEANTVATFAFNEGERDLFLSGASMGETVSTVTMSLAKFLRDNQMHQWRDSYKAKIAEFSKIYSCGYFIGSVRKARMAECLESGAEYVDPYKEKPENELFTIAFRVSELASPNAKKAKKGRRTKEEDSYFRNGASSFSRLCRTLGMAPTKAGRNTGEGAGKSTASAANNSANNSDGTPKGNGILMSVPTLTKETANEGAWRFALAVNDLIFDFEQKNAATLPGDIRSLFHPYVDAIATERKRREEMERAEQERIDSELKAKEEKIKADALAAMAKIDSEKATKRSRKNKTS
jgi:hypothetical protein